jgi:hypothetical protein
MAVNQSNLYYIIQSITIVVTGICLIAGIIWNRIVTRRRATIDMLLQELTNMDLLKMRGAFLEMTRSEKYVDYCTQETWYSLEALPLVSVLNRYETVAIGVAEGIIDKNIYRRYWRSGLIRDWTRCKRGVLMQRANFNNPKLFIEFEALALRWATAEERRTINRISN